MEIIEIINKSASIANEFSPALYDKFRTLQSSINHGALKIVVMGDFKTGKSTLINKVFLKKDLLPVEFREATAVPTRIREGEPNLKVFSGNTDNPVEECSDIKADTLAKYITASSDENRADLARKYSHVDVSLPGILPHGITLVDTPGLNTTNLDVMNSTYAEARTADGIIYVCRAAQLSLGELNQIRSFCGNQLQQFPLHVVLTTTDQQTPVQQEEIRKTIEAQLFNHGIKVQCSVFCLTGESAGGIFASSSAAKVNVLSDGVRLRRFGAGVQHSEHSFSPSLPTAEMGNTGLRDRLETFLCEQVRNGRMARLAREIKPLLQELIIALEACLSASDKSEEQLEERRNILEQKKKAYLDVVDKLLEEVSSTQQKYVNAMLGVFQTTKDDYCKRLDTAQDVADILTIVRKIQNGIACDVSGKLENATIDYQFNVQKLGQRYEVNLKERLMLNGLPGDELYLDMGPLARIPAMLVTILDYVLVIWSSPLPWYFDVPLRVLSEKIAFIKRFLPEGLAASLLKKKFRNTLVDALDTMERDMEQHLREALRASKQQLHSELLGGMQFVTGTDDEQKLIDQKLTDEQQGRLKELITQLTDWQKEI